VASLNMTGGAVDSAAGTLTLTGGVTATSDATGLGAFIDGNLALGTGVFTVNDGPGTVDLEGAANVSGAVALTKNGTGTMVLSGTNNTYTGGTVVNAGTLITGAVNTLPIDTPLTVAAGATVDLNGFSQQVSAVNGTGTVTSTAAGAPATLTINNAAAST